MSASSFEQLYTLGFDDGHAMVALWGSVAEQAGLGPPRALQRNDYVAGRVVANSLILVNWTQGFFRTDLDELLKTGASAVAFFCAGRTVSPEVVLDRTPRQLVDCYSEDAFAEDRFLHRVLNILGGRPPYAPFVLRSPSGRVSLLPRSVFAATPLEQELYAPFYRGVRAAMDKLGILVRSPEEIPSTTTINDKVLQAIDDSDVVIANIRQIRRRDQRGYNANVWYEIGYAWRADKPVLLFRHVTDGLKLPSDVQASDFHTYCDSVDLALQLFHGFGGRVVRQV